MRNLQRITSLKKPRAIPWCRADARGQPQPLQCAVRQCFRTPRGRCTQIPYRWLLGDLESQLPGQGGNCLPRASLRPSRREALRLPEGSIGLINRHNSSAPISGTCRAIIA